MKKTGVAVMMAVAAFSMQQAMAGVSEETVKALIERVGRLEAENKAQARRIAELESRVAGSTVTAASATVGIDPGTSTNDSGRVFTSDKGFKYYLADKTAGIFEPLTESGLRLTPPDARLTTAPTSTRSTTSPTVSASGSNMRI